MKTTPSRGAQWLVALGLRVFTSAVVLTAGCFDNEWSAPLGDADVLDADGEDAQEADLAPGDGDVTDASRDAGLDGAAPDTDPLDSGPVDPCAEVLCTSPPADTCLDEDRLRSFLDTGTCEQGSCTYGSTERSCLDGCHAGACDPTWGWDFNLNHRCLASPLPDEPNSYEDFTDCPVDGHRWAVAVQSEHTLGNACVGTANHSHPINTPGSPLSLFWQPHVDERGRSNWTVDIKTDFMNNTDPCGAGAYTWFAFMDHAYLGGGPFPSPADVVFSATVMYDDWTPNGAARAIAGWGGEWDGKGVLLEIDLQSANWGDAYPDVADIIQVVNNETMQWVSMSGAALGLTIARRELTPITINWYAIIEDLIARGYLVGPTEGLSRATTTSLSLATEVTNDSSTGAVAEMWITDFRVRSR